MIFGVVSPEWLVPITQTGVVGAVLAWFMIRQEGIMTGLTNSNTRLARAQLMLVIALDGANASAKVEAAAIIREIDEERAKKSGQTA